MASLTLLAILSSGVPLILRIFLATAVMAACTRAVSRLRLPIEAAGWSSRSGWTLRGVDGGDDEAVLLSFRVLGDCILLRLASRRYGKLTLWLMPDNADVDIRRRLRMRLATLPIPLKPA